MPRDNNRRLLANIHIEKSEGSKVNFVEKLASCGFNPFILHPRHRLKKAIDKNKEIFNLPEEAFTYPFRTRDMRRLTLNGHNAVYEKHRQINKPGDPTLAWAPIESSAPLDKGDKSGIACPTATISFYTGKAGVSFRPATFQKREHGLFVQPDKNTIRIDAHLCIYPNEVQCLKKSPRVTVHECTLFTL